MKGYLRTNARFWTPDEVMDCIRQLHAAGESLRAGAMRKKYRKLYRAGNALFGTWRKAVARAGLGDVLPERLPWSREKVLERIRQRKTKGLQLNYQAVQESDPKLALAGARHFKNWGMALKKAGFDPLAIAKWRRWSTAQLIAVAQERAEAGMDLSSHHMQTRMGGVHKAAISRFGAWDAFLKAAGLSPEEHRRHSTRWSKSKLLAFLRERQASGRPLNVGSIGNSAIICAARGYFGSWDGALRAMGLVPDRVRLRRNPWTRKEVRAAIVQRHVAGRLLNAAALQKEDRSLYQGACRLFGLWNKALSASGINPNSVQQMRTHWTRRKISKVISKRAGEGLSLAANRVRPSSVCQAAVRLFGSWLKALHAAQLTPEQRSRLRTFWSSDRIVEAIRERSREKSALNYATVRSEDPKLLSAGARYFGNWSSALAAAGIDPQDARTRREWTCSRVIRILRTRGLKGQSFADQGVTLNDVWIAAKHLFGSWAAAHRAAGLSGKWRPVGDRRRFVPHWSATAMETAGRKPRPPTQIHPSS